MKSVVLAIPNSVSDVLSQTGQLCRAGVLGPLSRRLLEMLYVLGWDDGFVEFNRVSLGRTLREESKPIDAALAELQGLHVISIRRGRDHEVAELIALSVPRAFVHAQLGWWQMYSIELLDDKA